MKYRIQEICREKGILMRDLAGKMERTPESLSRSLNNGTTTKMLEEIAQALEVEVYELFEQQKNNAETIGIVRHNGKVHEINSIEDVKRMLEEIGK